MMILACKLQKVSHLTIKLTCGWTGEKTLNVSAIKMKIYDNCQLLVHMTQAVKSLFYLHLYTLQATIIHGIHAKLNPLECMTVNNIGPEYDSHFVLLSGL